MQKIPHTNHSSCNELINLKEPNKHILHIPLCLCIISFPFIASQNFKTRMAIGLINITIPLIKYLVIPNFFIKLKQTIITLPIKEIIGRLLFASIGTSFLIVLFLVSSSLTTTHCGAICFNSETIGLFFQQITLHIGFYMILFSTLFTK